MRKFIIGAALAVSAVGTAVPAAAQYAPQPQQPYANNGYGNQQGYNNGYGRGRALMARVDQVRQQIRELGRRNMLSRRDAYGLDIQAQQLRSRIRQSAYNGVDSTERFDIERRLGQLEQRVRYSAHDRDGRNDGRGSAYGQNSDQNGNGQYANHDGRWQDRDGNWHDRDDRHDHDDRDDRHN